MTSTQSFQQSYLTISYKVIKAKSIKIQMPIQCSDSDGSYTDILQLQTTRPRSSNQFSVQRCIKTSHAPTRLSHAVNKQTDTSNQNLSVTRYDCQKSRCLVCLYIIKFDCQDKHCCRCMYIQYVKYTTRKGESLSVFRQT